MSREDAQEAWVRIVDIGFNEYDKLTNDQKVWFNIEPLTTDGIIDHYVNHGAEHNKDTIDGLEFLGHRDVADLLRDINRLFEGGLPPDDIDERNDEMQTWDGRHDELLDEINDKYWKLNDSLEKTLHNHISKTGIGAI